MAITGRKTWNSGDVLTANDMNAFVRESVLFSSGAGITSTPPLPAGGGFLIQAGQGVAATNSAGGFGFAWPNTFPTGVLAAIVTIIDTGIDPIFCAGIYAQISTTNWGGIAATKNGNVVSSYVRYSYIGIGW